MISIAQIRDAAAAVILERHPELVGLVSFDAYVPHVHPGMGMIELRIDALDFNALRAIAANVEPHPFGVPRTWPLGKILDHYCTNEPHAGCDFILGGVEWLIGDGDDSLALAEVSSGSVILWVRCWEE